MSWPRVLANAPDHPYVDRLHGRVARLVGREEAVPGGVPRPFDPSWVDTNALTWDIAHLHLGLDEQDPLDLGVQPNTVDPASPVETAADVDASRIVDVVAAHRRNGVPVVVTVHAIASVDDPTGVAVLELLQSISRDVAAVLTVTQGCADLLQERLGRPVRAIPHGPVVDAATRARFRAHRRRLDLTEQPLLLHAGSMPVELLWDDVLAAVARTTGDRALRVLVHAGRAEDAARAAAGMGAGMDKVRLAVHPGLSMMALERAVADASGLLLVDRRGCHSSLLELAADVGTPVIAADVGWRCQQQPVLPVPVQDGHMDVDALARTIDGPLPLRPMVRECERERDEHAFRSHHQRLYHRLLLGRTADMMLAAEGAHPHLAVGWPELDDVEVDETDLHGTR